jgi:predicted acyltransferase (DUF342 family)
LLGGLSSRANILTNEADSTYLISPVISGTTVTLTYDTDIQARTSELFLNGLNINYIYMIGKTVDNTFVNINYTGLTVATTNVSFTTPDDLSAVSTIVVYVVNVDLSTFVTSLYEDYISHTHETSGTTASISHEDLINVYTDSDSIVYKNIDTKNYQHPQYLNREGYNPVTPEVYNNAMLGDLFLAAIINSDDQVYKTLSKNSYGIIFGDPVSGSKLYYDTTLGSITLAASTSSNGLSINFNPANKGLVLNSNASIGEANDRTIIKGKGEIVDIASDTVGIDSRVYTDSFISRKLSQFLGGLTTTSISIGNVNLAPNGNVLEVSTADTTQPTPEAVSFLIPVQATAITVTSLTPSVYHFTDGATISISNGNSINSSGGKFQFNTTASVNFLSNGINTGIKVGRDSTNSLNLYNAGFTGQPSFNSDSDYYIEMPSGQSLYLLQPTTAPIVSNGVTYTFANTVTGTTTINSLKNWFRSDIYAGNVTGITLQLSASDTISKNGMKIGPYTRISTVGSQEDCPEGLTILESKGIFAFINPLQSTSTACVGVVYQDINTANIQAFGKISADTSIYAVGNITTGDTLISNSINNSQDLRTSTLLVTDAASFNGTTEFLNAVTIGNTLSVTGTVTVAGSMESTSITVDKTLSVGGLMSVNGQALFSENVTVQGALYTASGFTTTGPISSESLSTGPITASSIVGDGGLTVTGDSSLNGSVNISGNSSVQGNMTLSGNLTVSLDVTAKTLYVLDDASLSGRLLSSGDVSFSGNSITVGTANSTVQINGALQLNNALTTITGDLRVFGGLSVFGITTFGDDTQVKGNFQATSISVDANLAVGGTINADSGTFNRTVYFTNGIQASGNSTLTNATVTELTSTNATADTLYVGTSLSMGANSTVKTDKLQTSLITQVDPSQTSSFVGPVTMSNQLSISNSIVVGDPSILTTRNTAGVVLSANDLKMGNNSTIEAVKIFAGKGIPTGGDKDLTGGYCFASPAFGSADGDTGMFASAGDTIGTANSDIYFMGDGNPKGVFYSSIDASNNIQFNVNGYPYIDNTKAKTVITLDLLLETITALQTQVTNIGNSAVALAWPIGSIYMNGNYTDLPATLSSIGYWVRYAPGRTLVGMTSYDLNGTISGGLIAPSGFNTGSNGATYGEFAHTMSSAEMVGHAHYAAAVNGSTGEAGDAATGASSPESPLGNFYDLGYGNTIQGAGIASKGLYGKTSITGNGIPFNVVQPSIVTAMWMRVT